MGKVCKMISANVIILLFTYHKCFYLWKGWSFVLKIPGTTSGIHESAVPNKCAVWHINAWYALRNLELMYSIISIQFSAQLILAINIKQGAFATNDYTHTVLVSMKHSQRIYKCVYHQTLAISFIVFHSIHHLQSKSVLLFLPRNKALRSLYML